MALAAGAPDVVFHFAGPGTVGAAEDDPGRSLKVTALAMGDLIEWLHRRALGTRIIAASSAAVYGAAPTPFGEDDPVAPVSLYGCHKLILEDTLRVARLRGLTACAVRFFSLYGPGLRKQVLWDVLRRARSEGEVVLRGVDGVRRDFLFIDDAVRLLCLLADVPAADLPAVVNGGGGQALAVSDVCVRWLARTVPGARTIVTPGEAGEPRVMEADPTQAERLGFRPLTTLDEGLDRMAADALTALADGAAGGPSP